MFWSSSSEQRWKVVRWLSQLKHSIKKSQIFWATLLHFSAAVVLGSVSQSQRSLKWPDPFMFNENFTVFTQLVCFRFGKMSLVKVWMLFWHRSAFGITRRYINNTLNRGNYINPLKKTRHSTLDGDLFSVRVWTGPVGQDICFYLAGNSTKTTAWALIQGELAWNDYLS